MISYKNCHGCGVILQSEDSTKIGYVKNLEQDKCFRCFRLINYNELINYDLTEHDFLKNIEENNQLHYHYFYVLDIFDIDGSRSLELERIIQNNTVTIIVNKIDLINKLINEKKVLQYLESIFANAPIANKLENIILVSAVKNIGLDRLMQYIKIQKQNIFFVGNSNTGKSTLINSLIKMAEQKQYLTVSNNFATTLGNIQINLGTKHKIYDTPGIANYHNLVHYVKYKNKKKLVNNKLIKPITFQLNSEQTIFYEGLAAFSYLKGLKTSFHFYKNNNIALHRTKLENKNNYFEKHITNHSLTLDEYTSWEENKIIITEVGEYSLFILGLGWITFNGIKGQEFSIGTNRNIKISLRKRFI